MIEELSYVPGRQIAAVSPRGVAFFAPEIGRDAAAELWRHLDRGADMAQMLQRIAEFRNQQLIEIPPFALVILDASSVHFVVRGEFSVAVTSADGVAEVSGVGVTTWTERRIEDPWSVLIDGGDVATDTSSVMPISSGVVESSAIEIALSHNCLSEPTGRPQGLEAEPVDRDDDIRFRFGIQDDAVAGNELSRVGLDRVDEPTITAAAESNLTGASGEAHNDTLIDPSIVGHGYSVPDLDASDSAGVRDADQSEGEDYDFLWGATVPRTVEEAAIRTVSDSDLAPGDSQHLPGEDDQDELPRARGRRVLIDSVPSRFFSQDSHVNREATPVVADSGAVSIESAHSIAATPEDSETANGRAHVNGGSLASPGDRQLDTHPALDPKGEPMASPVSSAAAESPSETMDRQAPQPVPLDLPGIHESWEAQPQRGEATRDGLDMAEASPVSSYQAAGNLAKVGAYSGASYGPEDLPGADALAGARADAAAADARILRPEGASPLRVLAALCGHNHPNPPHALACRYCQESLVEQPILIDRPSLGRMQISTGGMIELDRSAIVGRRPKALRGQGDAFPTLITVPSPQQDISRNHLEIRLEGWHVLAADLESKNGTTLIRQGQAPVLLRPSEPLLVRHGDVLDLGDGVMVLFEDIA